MRLSGTKIVRLAMGLGPSTASPHFPYSWSTPHPGLVFVACVGARAMEPFGQHLRRLRNAAGLSQEELAERAGLTAAAVGALERSERRYPYPHTVRALASALALADDERRALVAAVPQRERPGPAPDPPDAVVLGTAVPARLRPLVGRARDVTLVTRLLRNAAVRLVTITGVGGVGKTSLAAEAARRVASRYQDGVFWIEFAALSDPQSVMPYVIRSLGITPVPGESAERLLAGYLRRRSLLLVLDNFEHLLDAAPALAALLRSCPAVDALVTSREPLHIDGEHEVQLAPLALPVPTDGHLHSAAVRLFVQCARSVVPGFRLTSAVEAPVVSVCRLLDGLPLAIELAAAQLKYLSPAALAEGLSRGAVLMPALRRDLPVRQRSLEATLEWSHDLLTPGQRLLFRRLSVFNAGCTPSAAVAVCSDEALSPDTVEPLLYNLVDKSLVRLRAAEEGRIEMLQTVQHYARGKLETSGESHALRARHASYFAALAEKVEPDLRGAGSANALRQLDVEAGNMHAALDWSVSGGDPCNAMRIVGALGWYWMLRGAMREAEGWSTRVLAAAHPETCAAEHLALARYTAAAVAWKRGDLPPAARLADQAIEVFRRDASGRRLGLALALRGLIAVSEGNPDRAIRLHEESLASFRAASYGWGVAYAYANLGDALVEQSELAAAWEHYNEALTMFTAEGDAWGEGIVLHTLGNIALRQRDFAIAREQYVSAIDLTCRLKSPMEVARSQIGFAAAALGLGDADAAQDALLGSLQAWRDFENNDGAAICLSGLAAVALARGQRGEAERLLADAKGLIPSRPSLYVTDPDVFVPYLAGLQPEPSALTQV